MSDSYVQVMPDSTGAKVDVSEITRADGETLVERQRIVISDPTDANQHAGVGPRGLSVKTDEVVQLLQEIKDLLEQIYQHQLEKLY